MISKEIPLISKISNKNDEKDFYKISRKILYQKYNEIFSLKRILTDFLIFNNKCRLTLFFKEFLLSDNGCEFLRHFYLKEDTKNILSKILEIYCLYSKIYPNYIILKENKFLYKNIRKKQKMIDENNKNNEIKKNNDKDNNINNNINNKDYELFTLSVRNEIKEFQEDSSNKNNIDSLSNNRINSTNTKKINDNWVFIINKNLNMNLNNSSKNNNNQYNKNMSFDSFWTNDTNNLSTLLNAINDKINIDQNKKNKKINDNNIKKKDISNKNINNKFLKNKNQNYQIQKKKEIKSSSKKTFKKIIYKKLENNNNKKVSSDNSRNDIFLKIKNKQNIINNLKTTKPLSSSLSNSTNIPVGLLNKGNYIYNHLLTEKNIDKEIKKNIHQYYSIQRDTSDKNMGNNLKKFIHPFFTKQKFYSKEYFKENKNSKVKKNDENNKLTKSNNLNNKSDKYLKRKFSPHEFLRIIMNESKKNSLNEKYNKEENAKNGSFNTNILYNTNKNFNNLRNKKYYLKKYFTNNNLHQKDLNQRYTYNLTESNSQTIINLKKETEFNSSCNYINKNNKINNNKDNNKENNRKTLNNCQTSNNYYISKNKNIKNFFSQKKFVMKKQNTEGIVLGMRDKILKRELGTAYIKKKCFSPLSNDYHIRFSLSRSCNIKNEKNNINKNNENIIQRIIINSEINNKLINIKKNIRKHFIQHDISSKELNFLSNKSIKINNSNNCFIMDTSQKENKNNSNKLILKNNIKNSKKIYLRKNFSPTLTYYNLYKSNNKDLTKSKTNINNNNNSEFIEYHHENLFIKRKNNITKIVKNDANIYNLDNKENNLYNNNNKKIMNINGKNQNTQHIQHMTKSKTEYDNFLPKYKNIHKNKKIDNMNEINKNFILKRFQKKLKNYYIFSKDKINNNNNLNEIPFQRFNNLSNSTINNNSNCNEFIITKNINNSLSNSTNNITEFQTPLIQKKRLKLIKKFIYQEQKEKIGHISNIEKMSSKNTIKVNRTKFLERVKEKMKNKIKSHLIKE